MKKKFIKLTIDMTIEAVDGNMFDTAGHAEEAVSNYLHEWLSDQTVVMALDAEAESYVEEA